MEKKKTKRVEVKELIDAMQKRAFDLRCMTGRGQSREDLKKDKVWSDLNDRYEQLTMK